MSGAEGEGVWQRGRGSGRGVGGLAEGEGGLAEGEGVWQRGRGEGSGRGGL